MDIYSSKIIINVGLSFTMLAQVLLIFTKLVAEQASGFTMLCYMWWISVLTNLYIVLYVVDFCSDLGLRSERSICRCRESGGERSTYKCRDCTRPACTTTSQQRDKRGSEDRLRLLGFNLFTKVKLCKIISCMPWLPLK